MTEGTERANSTFKEKSYFVGFRAKLSLITKTQESKIKGRSVTAVS